MALNPPGSLFIVVSKEPQPSQNGTKAVERDSGKKPVSRKSFWIPVKCRNDDLWKQPWFNRRCHDENSAGASRALCGLHAVHAGLRYSALAIKDPVFGYP
jgi:hypothetical protein